MIEAHPRCDANHALVTRLAESWPARAAVRRDRYEFEAAAEFDPARPDYPLALVPFADHPAFLAASPDRRAAVLTMAWCVYNARVITAEVEIACPAFGLLVGGAFRGVRSPAMRRALQQAVVDEHFHTYMHMLAVDGIPVQRGLAMPAFPPSVTYRCYRRLADEAGSQRERELLALVWTIVSEVSINAYLELLSRDETIQASHRLLVSLHARDEHAHSSLVVEVALAVYRALDDAQRRAFAALLPKALTAFLAEDLSAWRVILAAAGIPGGEEILRDSTRSEGPRLLTRDFSGVRNIVEHLGIADEVDFRFS